MSQLNRMGLRQLLGGSALALMPSVFGCGFDQPPAKDQQAPTAGNTASTAGMSPTAAGSPATAGADAGGASAGSSTMPLGGDAGAGQGGQVAQGGVAGAAAGAGAGGMSVAGGPPVYTAKPMSVVAYSPYRDGQAPGGAQPSKEDVKADLMMLKPYVDGVRVYGTDGANSYIPALCDELGIDLHIGAWIDGIASDEPNVHALATVVKENHASIKTAIVGNEVLARSAKNLMTEEKLLALINIFKADIGAGAHTYKLAAADTYPQWMLMRPNLAAAVDVVIWHTYGWWSGVDVANAYPLISSRYDDMLKAYPGKSLILGETGWPSAIDHMSTDKTTTAVGSEANQTKFYSDALVGMRKRNLPMWMFSSIDEKWKGTSGEGEVGAHWGIWDSARQPKAAVAAIVALPK